MNEVGMRVAFTKKPAIVLSTAWRTARHKPDQLCLCRVVATADVAGPRGRWGLAPSLIEAFWRVHWVGMIGTDCVPVSFPAPWSLPVHPPHPYLPAHNKTVPSLRRFLLCFPLFRDLSQTQSRRANRQLYLLHFIKCETGRLFFGFGGREIASNETAELGWIMEDYLWKASLSFPFPSLRRYGIFSPIVQIFMLLDRCAGLMTISTW